MRLQNVIPTIIASALVTACGTETTTVSVKSCYHIDDDAILISSALEDLSIPHKYDENQKCIYGDAELLDRKEEIELAAFGEPPPYGLSTTYRDHNQKFINRLNSNGIDTTIYIYKGIEYFAWSYENHEKAEELLEFEPWVREMMREGREQASSE